MKGLVFDLYNPSLPSYHIRMQSINRRKFISSTSISLSAMLMNTLSQDSSNPEDTIGTFKPFIKKDNLPNPVIIESLSMFKRDKNWFIRARSKDGIEGWSVGHPSKTELSQSVFTKVIAPFMRNKDARNLDRLVDEIFLSGSNYKMQGQLFWVQVAAAEFAILDLLGKTAKLSAASLLGGQKRNKIDLYIANNHRSKNAEESLRRIIKSVDNINAKALKIKIGGRMKVVDSIPMRT